MTYRWLLRPVENPDAVTTIQQQLNNLPEALARALVLRGIDTFDGARLYFRPSLDHLHDPFLMQDMDAAADRVVQAIRQGERVLVYGDYDVDGTTSTTVMTHFLRSMGVEADFFIPNRFTHGYGLHNDGIDHAADLGARLIITLDCGITAVEEARYARERGIDLIICDHHTASETPPDAVAVLDPKRPTCTYPFKELSGCGVTFKLVQATLSRLGEPPERALPYLDLVAISTASDIVPIQDENRVIMREGFAQLRKTRRQGLRAVAGLAGLDFNSLSVDRIVFSIGPRINAAGRMGEANRAVQLLLSEDPVEAADLARILEEANKQRRALDREIQGQAVRQAEIQLSGKMRHALVLHDPEWHQGVIGIVASRLVERFHRPAIMLCTANGSAKGSARSITGINIYNALQACDDLLTQFGGHDYAAGMTLPEENIPAFRDRLDEVVGAIMTPEMMIPAIEVDALLNLDALDDRFWNVLKQFAPFGPTNMKPVFQAEGLEVAGQPRTVGNTGAHLKLAVRQHKGLGGRPHPVIAFGHGEKLPMVQAAQREGRPLEMLFSIEENTWRGQTTIQLQARDLRVQEG